MLVVVVGCKNLRSNLIKLQCWGNLNGMVVVGWGAAKFDVIVELCGKKDAMMNKNDKLLACLVVAKTLRVI